MSEEYNENDLMFKAIKIYVVEYLTTVHGFKNFQHEAINILALYILRTIKEIAIKIKRMVSLQGITMPNCLHLVDLMYRGKFVRIQQIIQFLTKQTNNNSKNIQVFYQGLDNLGKSLFSQLNQDINGSQSDIIYSNIKYIPYTYTYSAQQIALPIKIPVDEGIKKPAQYTYKNLSQRVQKVEKNIEKLGNYSVRQMRRSLGILNNQEDQQKKGENPRKINAQEQQRQLQIYAAKNKFSMINFI